MKSINYDSIVEGGFEEIPFTFYGDYFGHLVCKSNYLTLSNELSRFKGFYKVYGGFSLHGIAYYPKELTKEGKEKVKQILESLEDYCLLDEGHYISLEYKIINEFFNEDYKFSGFPKYKKSKIRKIVLDHIGEYAVVETGCAPFINWDKIREEAEK